jgi:HisJ family histidinol phosphate phosphatase
MLFLWFYHAARRGAPKSLLITDHENYLTSADPKAVASVRRALALAADGDSLRAAETAGVSRAQAEIVGQALRNGCRFAVGIEADNDPRTPSDARAIVDALRPDWIIRSVHFLTIEHPDTGEPWAWPFDNPEFVSIYDTVGITRAWQLYVATFLRDLQTLTSDVAAHFYVPGKFGHWPSAAALDEYEDAFVEVCRARSLCVEFNTRILYKEHSEPRKEAYLNAHRRLLRKTRTAGVRIALGSDAHAVTHQGGCFDRALELLAEYGIDDVAFPELTPVDVLR